MVLKLVSTLVALVLDIIGPAEKLSQKVPPLPLPLQKGEVFGTQRPPMQWRPSPQEVPCSAAAFGDLKKRGESKQKYFSHLRLKYGAVHKLGNRG